jgi:2-methylcitrate dehydratase PrpD
MSMKHSRPGPAIRKLSEFLVNTSRENIPDRIMARAADCVLDVAGAAIAGRGFAGVQAIQAVFCQQPFPDTAPKASVWFDTTECTPSAAATINAMAATAADVDDGHRVAAGHPGAAVVAAAAATAESCGASFETFLTAIVSGYEAAVRVALSRNSRYHDSTVSGRWSGVGASVAAAYLQRVDAEIMAQAILISEQHAPRLSSAVHHGFSGSDVKEGIAWSVHTGMLSLELAKAGFCAYPDTFDQNVLYDPGRLTSDLGSFSAIDGLFFKPYACCRWIHSAIDALKHIIDSTRLTADEIDRVEVLTFERAAGLGNHVVPETETEAQFSIPFCLSTVAVRGVSALLPLDSSLIGNSEIAAFARKIIIRQDDRMEDLFPRKASAIVNVTASGRTLTKEVVDAWGDPANPMSRSDLQDKFRILAGGQLHAETVNRIILQLSQSKDGRNIAARDVIGMFKEQT